MKVLFGPVPSRRFGRSLGIDLFPSKTCTFDCLYCEVGSNPERTRRVRQTVPAEQVLAEISDYLSAHFRELPDCITFAGSGEPTLYRDIDRIIAGIHHMTTLPVVLLTNGSLLFRKNIRDRILAVDVLVPSLDAGSPEVFRRLNRPVSGITYDDLITGLMETRQVYRGRYILEVLLVDGFNTDSEHMKLLAEQIRRIDPDAVQVNTVFRPPADRSVHAADADTINRFVEMVGERAVPVQYYNRAGIVREIKGDLLEQVILKTVGIRPCTRIELEDSLGVSERAMDTAIRRLKERGRLREQVHAEEAFLCLPESEQNGDSPQG